MDKAKRTQYDWADLLAYSFVALAIVLLGIAFFKMSSGGHPNQREAIISELESSGENRDPSINP
ncbi:hypothetical protein JXD38_12640 [candidate division WOR-3 bacterium]|nr:hypothetical protein [candidate division WOR-3 bacterium]